MIIKNKKVWKDKKTNPETKNKKQKKGNEVIGNQESNLK